MGIKETLAEQEEEKQAKRLQEAAQDAQNKKELTKKQKELERRRQAHIDAQLRKIDEIIDKSNLLRKLHEVAEIKKGKFSYDPTPWQNLSEDHEGMKRVEKRLEVEWEVAFERTEEHRSFWNRLLLGKYYYSSYALYAHVSTEGIQMQGEYGLKTIPVPQVYDEKVLDQAVTEAMQKPYWKDSPPGPTGIIY